MTTREDLLAAIERIDRAGLTNQDSQDAKLVAWFGKPEEYDGMLDRLHRAFPQLFPPAASAPAPGGPEQQGSAAEAMRDAEEVLSRQRSTAAEFDREVIEALLHAHETTEQGRKALDDLDAEIEDAVRTSDLSTPAGAREFQRYLLTKLAQIIAIVETTNDDDASKEALAKALAALYGSQAAQNAPAPSVAPTDPPAIPTAPGPGPGPGSPAPPDGLDGYPDDYPDDFPVDDLDPVGPVPPESASAPASVPTGAPAMPTLPGLGGGSPGGAGLPGAGIPPGLLPAGWAPQPSQRPSPDEDLGADPADEPDRPAGADVEGDPAALTEADPRVVTLPDGQTVTAPTPQLAAVAQAAADGTPIMEAFRRQGITIPPPGTAVAGPVDQSRVTLGDLGMFTDRHALALGNGKALLDGQIQRIANVRGPSFLGWQHPPGVGEPAEPARLPTPTRPSATVST